MLLTINEIESTDQIEFATAFLELYAFTLGEANFTDIPISFETILEDAIANPSKYGLEGEADILGVVAEGFSCLFGRSGEDGTGDASAFDEGAGF